MAYEFYIQVEGTTQGKFKGTSPRAAWKDHAPCLSLNYEVSSPRDVATGQSSGKRQHKPVMITKEIDASSPQFFTALVTNEVLKTVLFTFVRHTKEGKEDPHYTIKLTNATVSRFREYLDKPAKHEERTDTHELEEVEFTFQKIEIEHKWGKTLAVDDWEK